MKLQATPERPSLAQRSSALASHRTSSRHRSIPVPRGRAVTLACGAGRPEGWPAPLGSTQTGRGNRPQEGPPRCAEPSLRAAVGRGPGTQSCLEGQHGGRKHPAAIAGPTFKPRTALRQANLQLATRGRDVHADTRHDLYFRRLPTSTSPRARGHPPGALRVKL